MDRANEIFISYTSHGGSGRFWSQNIRQHLEGRGVPCFRDAELIRAGDDFDQRIRTELAQIKLLIVVISAGVSDSDWVLEECEAARALDIPIVPVRIEADAKLPLVRKLHAVELHVEGEGLLDALGAQLRRHSIDVGSSVDPREVEHAYLQRLLGTPEVHWPLNTFADLTGQRLVSVYGDITEKAMGPEFIPPNLRFQVGREAGAGAGGFVERAVPVESALATLREARRIALLGEPGAGKSWLLGRLAGELAGAVAGDAKAPLPMLVRLGRWIDDLGGTDQADADAALLSFLHEQVGPDVAARWAALVAEGRLVLLLDGLNELPGADRDRRVQAVWNLMQQSGLAAAIVSCRSADFEKADTRLALSRLTLAPLSPSALRSFFRSFFERLEPDADTLFWHIAGGSQQLLEKWQETGRDFDGFWDASIVLDREDDDDFELRYERPRLLENPRTYLRLAERPFFANVFALLYARAGDLSAFSGNRAQLVRAFVDAAISREAEEYAKRHGGARHPGEANVLAGLGALAWELQYRDDSADKVQVSMRPDDAEQLMGQDGLALAKAANLVRWERQVWFGHQLFQEYFAALGLARQVEQGLQAQELFPGPDWWGRSGWEESVSFLLAAHADEPAPWADWLADAQPQVLAEALQAAEVSAGPDTELGRSLHRRWQPRLLSEAAPEARHNLGNALDLLGLDDRPGIGLLPSGTPDIEWCEVPAGSFVYGSDDAEDQENGAQSRRDMHLSAFAIARFPITNAQYDAFVAAGGYDEAEWWQGLGERPSLRASRWPQLNRPRTDVSWYEAVAFCRWLSAGLGYEVRLPTEFEWERAARGTDGRAFPWGEGYEPGAANVNETSGRDGPHYLGETSAVGIYPQDESPCGARDMAGNVWEWCLNEYKQPDNVAVEGDRARVLRGGDWGDRASSARSARRVRGHPGGWGFGMSFRVCRASPMPQVCQHLFEEA